MAVRAGLARNSVFWLPIRVRTAYSDQGIVSVRALGAGGTVHSLTVDERALRDCGLPVRDRDLPPILAEEGDWPWPYVSPGTQA